MADKHLFVIILAILLFLNSQTSVNSINNVSSINCKVGKPLRKQIEVEPLNGFCLRDIATQISKTLRNISNEELGITSFQETLDNLEFSRVPDDLNSTLKYLADKLESKLKFYTDLIDRSNNIVEPILKAKLSHNMYSNPPRAPDVCIEIQKGIRLETEKNYH